VAMSYRYPVFSIKTCFFRMATLKLQISEKASSSHHRATFLDIKIVHSSTLFTFVPVIRTINRKFGPEINLNVCDGRLSTANSKTDIFFEFVVKEYNS